MKKPDNEYLCFTYYETKIGEKVTLDKPLIMHPYKIQKGSSSQIELALALRL